jgi:thymidylate kinase
MFIVFEGPDGSGKSTLAEAVQKKLDATRVHCGPPEHNNAEEQWMAIVEMADTDGFNVVCDRLHWGDPVYAPLYRPEVGEQLGITGLHRINQAIADAGGIIVLVTADPDVLKERFDGQYIDTHDLEEIVEAYELLWHVAEACDNLSLLLINTTNGFDDFDAWVNIIILAAEQATEAIR